MDKIRIMEFHQPSLYTIFFDDAHVDLQIPPYIHIKRCVKEEKMKIVGFKANELSIKSSKTTFMLLDTSHVTSIIACEDLNVIYLIIRRLNE